MNKLLVKGIILTLLIVFLGLNVQLFAYNKPSSYGQYNYRYNSGYMPMNMNTNAYRISGAANYVAGYGNYGWNPFLMPSKSYNPLFGWRTNYDSHIYIDNKLDYVYYKNPGLLEPRRMNNHQRYVKGLWPQNFWY